jgi:hypothetical protein
MRRSKEPEAPVSRAGIHAFHGEYWVVTKITFTVVKAHHYEDHLRQLELDHLQFSAFRQMRTIDDQVSLVLYKYR